MRLIVADGGASTVVAVLPFDALAQVRANPVYAGCVLLASDAECYEGMPVPAGAVPPEAVPVSADEPAPDAP